MPRSTVHGGVTHGRQEVEGTSELEYRRARARAEEAARQVGEKGAEVVQIPAGNASTGEWRSFVAAQHAPDFPGDVESASRDELRDWFHVEHGGGDQPADGGDAGNADDGV